MKILIHLVLSVFLISSTAPVVMAEHHHVEQHQSHVCPMHPDVTGQQGDTCPQCGMNLEKAKKCPNASAEHCPNKGNCDKCPKTGKCKCCADKANTENCPNKGNCDKCPKTGKCKCCADKANTENCPNKGNCDKCPKTGKCKCCADKGNGENCPNKAKSDKCPQGCKCDSCAKKKADSTAKHTHACPMNADITGVAGDTCPKCGMDLMPIKGDA